MNNPLDGEYKFQNCIFRAKTISIQEVAGCGGCGGMTKKFDQGFLCEKRGILLNENNRSEICGPCWVGKEVVDGIEKDFICF